ncbi:uroporphyrinogen-III synthase-like [Diabrotica virgifera virgifera]|uniref:Tetrapyrrole biosynthesis uroporphyrinogen III synthase domain-containing protein n=1 Tax=Diabrotica virgifera virgifera TaxID=50390 RepID=A0ABM5JMG4_DIAVI|nr:uroporphyrinogen-III synthase-like [Diabrotica virgifera virgifera]
MSSQKYTNTVLLLKTQSNETSDKYAQLLTDNGFQARQVKTLVFQFKNLNILAEKLNKASLYSGIIFSSPRCVQAVKLACQEADINIKDWQSKNNFVVGTATYTEALQSLGFECRGSDSGNAVNLLEYMKKVVDDQHSLFLYPHGNLKSDSFSKVEEKQKIQVEGVLVYHTIDNPNVEEEISDATNNFTETPEFMVFFSPSGLESSIEYLRKLPLFESSKLMAIGPTTEAAMKDLSLPVFGVAKQPNPKDVLDLLLPI